MFEGSDLSMAYGSASLDGSYSAPSSMPAPPPQVPVYNPNPAPAMPAPPAVQQKAAPQMMVSLQQPGDLPYQPPEAMYAQQKAQPTQLYEESFFDRLASKKFEVLKMVVFSLIILLAISMDRFFTHYLTQYITQSILTTTQEMIIRGAYPIAIILAVWFAKAM